MNYALFVAKRYLIARRKQAFISVITFISALGIAIGVMALVIAVALITGFHSDVQNKILSSTSHIMVSDLTGGEGLADYPAMQEKIAAVEGVQSVSPVVYNQALIKGPYREHPTMLKGIDFEAEKQWTSWLDSLESGHIPNADLRRPGIVLGSRVALEIGAGIGDIVTAITSAGRLSPMGLIPKFNNFVVTGIFKSGLYQFDSTTALIHLDVAQKIFKLENRISYFQVRIHDIFEADRVDRRIRDALPPVIYNTTWMELNRPLFSALKLEKTIIFLTITLIVIVAALNIIASLIL
ncbi:MAG: ABC transporter permease, partial [Candidatus Aminicenantes bacterium]|nr:ABC transporter permease [Candidatus Aminicenantes bacterium]